MLPVGGTITVTSRRPNTAWIATDSTATADSYGAQVMTQYIIHDWLENHPEDFAALADSTAQCVNGTAAVWTQLPQDQSASAIASTAFQAFWNAAPGCIDLREKIKTEQEVLDEAVDLPALKKEAQQSVADMLQTSAERGLLAEIEDVGKTLLEHPSDWHG